MKVVLIILIVLILILFMLLIARISLCINTYSGIYRLSYGRILSGSFVASSGSPHIMIRLLFITFRINPWQSAGRNKKSIKKKSHKRSFRFSRMIRWIGALISSLKIDHFEADIDTGDYPLNAQLMPLACLAGNAGMNIRINFEERNNLDCRVQTRPLLLLWNYITNNN